MSVFTYDRVVYFIRRSVWPLLILWKTGWGQRVFYDIQSNCWAKFESHFVDSRRTAVTVNSGALYGNDTKALFAWITNKPCSYSTCVFSAGWGDSQHTQSINGRYLPSLFDRHIFWLVSTLQDLKEAIRIEVAQIDRAMMERVFTGFVERLDKCIIDNRHYIHVVIFHIWFCQMVRHYEIKSVNNFFLKQKLSIL